MVCFCLFARSHTSHVRAFTPRSQAFEAVDTFLFDPGDYNSKFLSIYVTCGMQGVGSSKERVSCNFTKKSFE